MRTLAALILIAAPALAGDDSAPPMQGAAQYTPPLPSPGSPPAPLTEERVAQIVDASLTRAMARLAATSPTASAQAMSQPATASPQAAYVPPPPVQYATAAPAPQTINVLVPPGPCHRMMGKLGEHLVQKGQPKIRTVVVSQTQYTTVTVQPTPTVQVAPTQYTPVLPPPPPPAPVVVVQPTPSAPAKASAQR